MYVKALEFMDSYYENLPLDEQKEAMKGKVRHIPTKKAFGRVMYYTGITQRRKQLARLVTEKEEYLQHKKQYKENNRLIIGEDTDVFLDKEDAKGVNIPKGKEVVVYTRKHNKGFETSRTNVQILEVAYLLEGKIFILGGA